MLPFGSVWISVIAFGLVYCNAVTLITDLICALFGPYAAMFVNRIYPGKSLKMSFVSPGKPWNLIFASPGKSWKTVFYCLYEPWDLNSVSCWDVCSDVLLNWQACISLYIVFLDNVMSPPTITQSPQCSRRLNGQLLVTHMSSVTVCLP